MEDEIKKWQEYTEELHKKGLNDPDIHHGVTHLQPDILKCEVLVGLSASAQSLQSYPTLCDPSDCSPPGSSIHGIL